MFATTAHCLSRTPAPPTNRASTPLFNFPFLCLSRNVDATRYFKPRPRSTKYPSIFSNVAFQAEPHPRVFLDREEDARFRYREPLEFDLGINSGMTRPLENGTRNQSVSPYATSHLHGRKDGSREVGVSLHSDGK